MKNYFFISIFLKNIANSKISFSKLNFDWTRAKIRSIFKINEILNFGSNFTWNQFRQKQKLNFKPIWPKSTHLWLIAKSWKLQEFKTSRAVTWLAERTKSLLWFCNRAVHRPRAISAEGEFEEARRSTARQSYSRFIAQKSFGWQKSAQSVCVFKGKKKTFWRIFWR